MPAKQLTIQDSFFATPCPVQYIHIRFCQGTPGTEPHDALTVILDTVSVGESRRRECQSFVKKDMLIRRTGCACCTVTYHNHSPNVKRGDDAATEYSCLRCCLAHEFPSGCRSLRAALTDVTTKSQTSKQKNPGSSRHYGTPSLLVPALLIPQPRHGDVWLHFPPCAAAFSLLPSSVSCMHM